VVVGTQMSSDHDVHSLMFDVLSIDALYLKEPSFSLVDPGDNFLLSLFIVDEVI
jgi:hypothetical protein